MQIGLVMIAYVTVGRSVMGKIMILIGSVIFGILFIVDLLIIIHRYRTDDDESKVIKREVDEMIKEWADDNKKIEGKYDYR